MRKLGFGFPRSAHFQSTFDFSRKLASSFSTFHSTELKIKIMLISFTTRARAEWKSAS